MELNLEDQKQHLLNVYHSCTYCYRLEALPDWLRKVDFFEAPASGNFRESVQSKIVLFGGDQYTLDEIRFA